MELLQIVLLVFAFLQIILFFKIWGMTNDIKNIKDILLFQSRKGPQNDRPFEIGDIVYIKSKGVQAKIKGVVLNGTKFDCWAMNGLFVVGCFSADELEHF